MKFKSFIFFIILIFPGILVNAQNTGGTQANTVDSQPLPYRVPSSGGYRIGPGDQVVGKAMNEPEYDFVATVDEDGKIEVPFVKTPIIAQCRTERELRAELTTVLQTYLRNPQMSVRVTEKRSRPPVSVYGEIMKAMEITLMRKAALIEVLAIAGGVKEEAGGQIQVFRTRPPMCASDNDKDNWKAETNDSTDVPSRMYSLANVKAGKEDSNPIIYPGDVIVVQRAAPIYITGEVVAAQGVYLKENGLSLTEALAMVGGVRPQAKTKDIIIHRLKPGSTPESKDRDLISANFDLIRKGKQKDIMLQANDVIVVDKAKEPIGVTILNFALGAGKAAALSVSNGIGYRVIY